MSNSLFKDISKLNGSNYRRWAREISAALRSQGLWGKMHRNRPTYALVYTVHKNGNDVERTRNRTYEECSDEQKEPMTKLSASSPSVSRPTSIPPSIRKNRPPSKSGTGSKKPMMHPPSPPPTQFKQLLALTIPENNHPASAFAKMQAHFTALQEFNHEVPEKMQVMLALAKLPKYSDFAAQLLNSKPSNVDEQTTLPLIERMTLAAWQQYVSRHKPNHEGGHRANKISAVKRKGEEDPTFDDQKEDGKDEEKKKRRQGKRSDGGEKKRESRREHAKAKAAASKELSDNESSDSDTTLAPAKANKAKASSSFVFANMSHAPVVIHAASKEVSHPIRDVRKNSHTVGAAQYGPPVFPQMTAAISLTRRLEITLTAETVRHLEPIATRCTAWERGYYPYPSPIASTSRTLLERLEDTEHLELADSTHLDHYNMVMAGADDMDAFGIQVDRSLLDLPTIPEDVEEEDEDCEMDDDCVSLGDTEERDEYLSRFFDEAINHEMWYAPPFLCPNYPNAAVRISSLQIHSIHRA